MKRITTMDMFVEQNGMKFDQSTNVTCAITNAQIKATEAYVWVSNTRLVHLEPVLRPLVEVNGKLVPECFPILSEKAAGTVQRQIDNGQRDGAVWELSGVLAALRAEAEMMDKIQGLFPAVQYGKEGPVVTGHQIAATPNDQLVKLAAFGEFGLFEKLAVPFLSACEAFEACKAVAKDMNLDTRDGNKTFEAMKAKDEETKKLVESYALAVITFRKAVHQSKVEWALSKNKPAPVEKPFVVDRIAPVFIAGPVPMACKLTREAYCVLPEKAARYLALLKHQQLVEAGKDKGFTPDSLDVHLSKNVRAINNVACFIRNLEREEQAMGNQANNAIGGCRLSLGTVADDNADRLTRDRRPAPKGNQRSGRNGYVKHADGGFGPNKGRRGQQDDQDDTREGFEPLHG